MSAYYQFIDKNTDAKGAVTATYSSTNYAQGAWNTHEQHMAPASGIITRELEAFQPRPAMRLGRISFDIFGLIPSGEFSITTRLIRPGKTIELIESEMQAEGKTCITARAWRMSTQDSSEIAALEDPVIHHPDTLPSWDGISHWPGGYIKSLEAKVAEQHRPGKGIVWLNNAIAMVANQPSSDFVHLIGMVDTANGTAPRQSDDIAWAFPNLDLQIHLHRYPSGRWLGLETVQQYGSDGIGLTSSILHDIYGPFGRGEQILTLRKLR
ncbi:MAG: thioesterase family protein [Pseudomonadaceae bacterium]|nr:thioesterase family protein [Pseudomonadaceae bacterium]